MSCPICKKPVKTMKQNKHFPFCCEQHKLIDLYNWFSGEYNYQEPEPAPLVLDDGKGEN